MQTMCGSHMVALPTLAHHEVCKGGQHNIHCICGIALLRVHAWRCRRCEVRERALRRCVGAWSYLRHCADATACKEDGLFDARLSSALKLRTPAAASVCHGPGTHCGGLYGIGWVTLLGRISAFTAMGCTSVRHILLVLRQRSGLLQVVHLEEDDKEGEDAGAFYSALGVDNPSSVSIKAAAS